MATLPTDFNDFPYSLQAEFVLSYSDIETYGEDAISEESEMSEESRRMLDEICSQVSDVCEEVSGTFGDFAADLDEILQ